MDTARLDTRRSLSQSLLVVSAFVLLATGNGTAAATDAPELSDQGLELYRKGDYAAAAERFQESYELSHRPVLLYNLGQAFRRLGDCARAAAAYRQFLAEAPESPLADKVKAQMASLTPCPTDAETQSTAVRTPAGSSAATVVPGIVSVPALSATAFERPPAPAPPSPIVRHFYERWWFWTGVGVLVAGAAVGVALAMSGRSSSDPCLGQSFCVAVKP